MTGHEPGPAPQAADRHALVGPRALWHEKRTFQFRFLRDAGLQPGHRLLDLGCGTLRGGIPLIDYLQAGHYTGVDVRPHVITEARRECDDHGLAAKSPVLLCHDDLRRLALPHRFDVVWAFSVLIHMDDDTLDAALACVRRHLHPGGQFLANVNLGDRPDGAWQGFPLVWRSMAFYDAAFRRHGLHVVDLGTLARFGNPTRHRDPQTEATQHMLRAIPAGG